jgi:hypothetical protein
VPAAQFISGGHLFAESAKHFTDKQIRVSQIGDKKWVAKKEDGWISGR